MTNTGIFIEKKNVFAVVNSLNFRVPVLVMLMALHPLVPLPYVLPRWGIFIALSFFGLLIVIKDRGWIKCRCNIPLALFLGAVLLSALFSDYQMEAWLGAPGYMTGFISHLGFTVLFVLALETASRSSDDMDKVLHIWLLAAFIIAWVGLLQYFGLNLLPYGNKELFQATTSYSTIYNTNDLGNYLVMVFPFAAYLFLKNITAKTTLFVASIYGATLTSLTRGAWFALAAGILCLFYFYPRKKTILMLILILVLVTLALLPLNDWTLYNRIGTFSTETEKALEGDPEAGAARFLLWQEGVKALPQSLFMGTGPDTYFYVSAEKFDERFGEGARAARKAHNIFLEIAITMGIPALIFYLWFIISIVSRKNLQDPLHLAFLSMVVIYFARGVFLVDVIQVYPLFWVLLGFYAGIIRTRSGGLAHA